MVVNRSSLVVLGAMALLIGGCSFSSDALWPSLSGEAPARAIQASGPVYSDSALQPSTGESSGRRVNISGQQPLSLNSTNFEVQPPRPGVATGTFVGQKVLQLRNDLRRLQESIRAHNGDLQNVRQRTIINAQTYHTSVATIRSRLQVGTTPGNPMLVNSWNDSQRLLEQVNADIGDMNDLSNRVAADAALSTFLLDATRAAFGLSGAVDEDHRQLEVLEDDVNRTVVLIDRLLTELSDDIRRQSRYVATERNDLNTLALAIKNGEFYGSSLASRAYGTGGATVKAMPVAPGRGLGSPTGSRRPLVVIRFDRPSVNYQQALYTAVSRALERRPDASFDLVAVSPSGGSTAQAALDTGKAWKNAQDVLRALTDMGLPPSRVTLSAITAADTSSNEVRLFIR